MKKMSIVVVQMMQWYSIEQNFQKGHKHTLQEQIKNYRKILLHIAV